MQSKIKCIRCGFQWLPVSCPNCKSYRWNVPHLPPGPPRKESLQEDIGQDNSIESASPELELPREKPMDRSLDTPTRRQVEDI